MIGFFYKFLFETPDFFSRLKDEIAENKMSKGLEMQQTMDRNQERKDVKKQIVSCAEEAPICPCFPRINIDDHIILDKKSKSKIKSQQ